MNYFVRKDVPEKGWTKGQVVNLDSTESAEWLKNGTLAPGSHAPPDAPESPAPTTDEADENHATGARRSRR